MSNKDHHLACTISVRHGHLRLYPVPATVAATEGERLQTRATLDTALGRCGGFNVTRDVLGREVASERVTSWAYKESATKGEEAGNGGGDEDLGMGKDAGERSRYSICGRRGGKCDSDIGRRGTKGDRVAFARTELVGDATGKVHVWHLREEGWRRVRWR